MENTKNIEKRFNEVLLKYEELTLQAKKTKQKMLNRIEEELTDLELRKKILEERYAAWKDANEDSKEKELEELEKLLEDSLTDKVRDTIEGVADWFGGLKAWAESKGNELNSELNKRISDVDESIERLEAQLKDLGDETTAFVNEEIETLKKKREELLSYKAKEKGSEAWSELKTGFVEAGSALKDAFKKAYNNLK
jgi:ABC-type phosphate transport system auxiliary subunit